MDDKFKFTSYVRLGIVLHISIFEMKVTFSLIFKLNDFVYIRIHFIIRACSSNSYKKEKRKRKRKKEKKLAKKRAINLLNSFIVQNYESPKYVNCFYKKCHGRSNELFIGLQYKVPLVIEGVCPWSPRQSAFDSWWSVLDGRGSQFLVLNTKCLRRLKESALDPYP